jgi:hypothetical protein
MNRAGACRPGRAEGTKLPGRHGPALIFSRAEGAWVAAETPENITQSVFPRRLHWQSVLGRIDGLKGSEFFE